MAGTGNPVPSDAIADLKANADTLDQFVSSTGVSATTRTGKEIKTIHAIEQESDTLLSNKESEFDTLLSIKESEFDNAIQSTGWFVVGNFADGFTFTAYNQVGRDANGNQWSYNGSLPFTVTAGTVPSEPNYTNRGDAALRSEFQRGELRATNYTTDRTLRRGGLNSHGLHLTTEKVRPVVSFIDDDGRSKFLTKLKPIFDSKGIKTALAIYTAGPDNSPTVLTWQEIKDLYDEGYEILSHTHTSLNLDGVSASQAEYEFSQSRLELEGRGIDVESFVYVQGVRGSFDVRDLVRKYFRSAYVTLDEGIQQQPLQDWFVRRKDAVDNDPLNNPTLQELKALVDYAEANNEWAVFTTHAAYGGLDAAQQQVISDLIDYIKSKGIEILTPSKALDIHGSRFFAGNANDELFQANSALSGSFFKLDKMGNPFPGHLDVTFEGIKDQSTPIDQYPSGQLSVFRTDSGTSWVPTTSSVGIVETFRYVKDGEFGWQRFTPEGASRVYFRSWNRFASAWENWREYADKYYLGTLASASKPMGDYALGEVSIERTSSSTSGLPLGGSTGLVFTSAAAFGDSYVGFQIYSTNLNNKLYTRIWDYSGGQWLDWALLSPNVVYSGPPDANLVPTPETPIIQSIGYNTQNAIDNSMPEDSAGALFWYKGSRPDTWNNYQTYHVFRSGRMYHRYYDDTLNAGAGAWSIWRLIGGGADGTFTTADSKTVTVTNGVITSIV